MDATSTPATTTPEICSECGEADPFLYVWADGFICTDCLREDHYSYLWDF